MTTNRQWLLRERPTGMVGEEHFEQVETALPTADLGAGEVLLKTVCLGFDPAMRGWLIDEPSYLPPVGIGEVMRASSVSEVIKSENPDLPAGTLVQGLCGWQEYSIGTDDSFATVFPASMNPRHSLGALGSTGVAAYVGLMYVGRPKEGDTVLVSGAAGATGSLAGQIAKIKGCRVVGIAGSDAKCKHVVEDLGFDACINYKSDGFREALKQACPKRIDIYFDNVGGWILNEALGRLNMGARIALCGAISVYNADKKPPGPANYLNLITARGTMQGFNGMDHWGKHPEISAEIAQWMEEGRIKVDETILDGLEEAWRSVNMLFTGENLGKLLVRVADPQ